MSPPTMTAKEKRLLLMLKGTIVLYEDLCDKLLPMLYKPENSNQQQAFELLGCALHWMRQETEKA